ncbi:MAG: hypothetical protein KA479_08145 [Saprospiraceae bacterium]|nr:hypothetical protein [Saprospiraceae bacterium]
MILLGPKDGKYAFLIFGSLLISSCGIISFNPNIGKYSGFEHTSKLYPGLIQKSNPINCNSKTDLEPMVCIANGLDIRSCIQKEEKAIVYLWHPTCKGPNCIAPTIIQSICKSNNVELFIVARSYRFETLDLIEPLDRPVFGIDTKYYSTDVVADYVPLFFSELLGKDIIIGTESYFLFERGKLMTISDRLQPTGN